MTKKKCHAGTRNKKVGFIIISSKPAIIENNNSRELSFDRSLE